MKITFLGTSHGVPEVNRHCSSLMVEAGDKTYIVDGGAPVIDCILCHGKTPKDISTVFTTHSHGDHVYGLLHLINLLDWYYKEDEMDFYFTEQRLIDAINVFFKTARNCAPDASRIRMHVAPKDFVFDDGTLRVTYIPTKHIAGGDIPSYAMLLEADGCKVLVTGDLSQRLALEDFPKIASEIELDVVICEMAHFGVSAVTPYLETCKTKQFWFTHIAPAKRFEEIRAIQGAYPFEICIAEDDDVIEV